MPTTVTAITRKKPEPGAYSHDGLELDVIEKTADDYDTAVEAIRAGLPDGWQILSLRRY